MKRTLLALALSATFCAPQLHAAWQADALRNGFFATSDRVSSDGYTATLNVVFNQAANCRPSLALLTVTPDEARERAVSKTIPEPLKLTVDGNTIARWPSTLVHTDGKIVVVGNDLTPDALIALAKGNSATVTLSDDPNAAAHFALTNSRNAIAEAFASCLNASNAQSHVVIP